MRPEFVYAARARWRADLLEMGATMHEGIGDTVSAKAKREQAELHRLDADLLDRIGLRIDAYDAIRVEAVKAASADQLAQIALGQASVLDLPGVEMARADVAEALNEHHDALRTWRQIDEIFGNRQAVVNNFSEPSYEELEGSLS